MRRSAVLILSALGVMLVLLVAGCGGDDFPTGEWTTTAPDGSIALFVYEDDGTWVLSSGPTEQTLEEVSSGTYSTTDETITLETDSYCKGVDPTTEQATYRWSHENDQLTFSVVEDECTDRVEAQDGLTLDPAD